MTNRRVNALEFVLIPRIAAIIDYIKQELDEIDREDFVRLKKTQDNKKKKKALEAREAAKRKGHATNDNDAEDGLVAIEEEDVDVLPQSQHYEVDDDEDEDIFV